MKGRGEKKKIHRRPSSLCLCVCLCVWAEAVKAAAETSLCGRDIKNRCRRLFLSGVTDSQRKARLPRQPRPVGRLRKVSASAPAWWFVESPRSSTDLGSVQRGGGEKRGEVRVWRCSTSVMECKARFLFWKRSSLSLRMSHFPLCTVSTMLQGLSAPPPPRAKYSRGLHTTYFLRSYDNKAKPTV